MTVRGRRTRAGLLGPVLLIGLGAVALLLTTGVIDQAAGGRLLALWPLLLVAVGVEVVALTLVPGRAGALVAVVAMLAIGGAGVGAALAARPPASSTHHASAPLGELSSGVLHLGTGPGTVLISGSDLGGDLYQASITSTRDAGPSVDVRGGTVQLGMPDGWWWTPGATNDVDLTLSDRVPWAITLDGAGLGGRADLTGLDVSSVAVRGTGAHLELDLPAALDRTVAVTVAGVGMDVTVRVPAETAARAEVHGLGTDLQVNGSPVGGRTWTNAGSLTGGGRAEISEAGVGSHIRVEVLP